MHSAPDVRLAAFVEATYGVFTAAHARALGFTAVRITARIAAGLWIRLYDDVYRLIAVSQCWKGNLLAACWAGGFRAAASHRSAAALWELPGGRQQLVEITCPRWRRARHDGVIVHETTRIDPLDLTVKDGIPVTTVERTLLDLGAVCTESVVELAVNDAERRELTTIAALHETLRRLGRPGRNGAGKLRRVLDRHSDTTRTESVAETRMLQVLCRHRLPDPVTQFEIRENGRFVARVDAAYPDWGVVIEYESDKHHTGRLATRRDNARRRDIIAAGYTPVPATHDDLRTGGHQLVRAIRAAAVWRR
jgi:hypothetical protein